MYTFVDIDIIMPTRTAVFDTFHPLSCDVTCVLDPSPIQLLISHLSSINLCFSADVFPTSCNSSIIFPLFKKTRSGSCDFEKLTGL